ncbi:hypothetical protein BCR42DRAFT_453266 [Absidia repens]|uniref:Uncharacterized protein n=1 Tax=Absidia repens TaxID=90262 RepID=A0A1X2IBR0_9FUNG|nr:hypothetical protein BCR42DRAFT_453266 [Absidia repens]
MFLLKNTVKSRSIMLSRLYCISNINKPALTCTSQFSSIRSYTSSFSNGKDHDSNNQNGANTSEDEEKMNNDSQEPFVGKQPPSTSEPNLSFMPVINIPQTEFAHNAFFSLHRPLLGLADDDEKPFFSNKPIEEDDVDDELANYMMNLRHFEAPGSPGTVEQEKQEKQDKGDKDYTMVTFSTGDSMLSEEEFYVEQSLPMYHFPESDEIVDYLSSMQEQLVRKNALEDSTNSTVGRTRRRKAAAATSTNQQEPRTASTSTSSSPYTAISKYQKRHQLGLYRHRWNK